MDELIAQGAEGVMLHLAKAEHTAGRSNVLLKLKPYPDAEAVVIEHIAGKGKYKNMLGALKVATMKGLNLKLALDFLIWQRKFLQRLAVRLLINIMVLQKWLATLLPAFYTKGSIASFKKWPRLC